jgi:hypothetical protein
VLIKEEVKATEIKKGTGMVEILIEYRNTESLDKKKVPLSWTLGSLKNFFSKTSKIPVGMLKLTCMADEEHEGGDDRGPQDSQFLQSQIGQQDHRGAHRCLTLIKLIYVLIQL